MKPRIYREEGKYIEIISNISKKTYTLVNTSWHRVSQKYEGEAIKQTYTTQYIPTYM